MEFVNFFFYNSDISFNLLALFLLFSFLFFFVVLMSDFMVFKQGYTIFGKKNALFENSFLLNKVVLQFCIFVFSINLVTFFSIFIFLDKEFRSNIVKAYL